jgi:hypothetical protein
MIFSIMTFSAASPGCGFSAMAFFEAAADFPAALCRRFYALRRRVTAGFLRLFSSWLFSHDFSAASSGGAFSVMAF